MHMKCQHHLLMSQATARAVKVLETTFIRFKNLTRSRWDFPPLEALPLQRFHPTTLVHIEFMSQIQSKLLIRHQVSRNPRIHAKN